MRISDWSSDVCSSDLRQIPTGGDIPEMKARVTITLKPGVLDPQGKAIEHALASLGFAGVESARAGKVVELDLADGTSDDDVEAMCRKLLANTVIENYRIESL